MFMRDPATDAPALRHGALLWGGLAAATALTILFGLFPTALLQIVEGGGRRHLVPAGRRAEPAAMRPGGAPAPPAAGRRHARPRCTGRPPPAAPAAPAASYRGRRRSIPASTRPAARASTTRLERIDVAQLVAEDDDRARAVPLEEPLDRLALAAGVAPDAGRRPTGRGSGPARGRRPTRPRPSRWRRRRPPAPRSHRPPGGRGTRPTDPCARRTATADEPSSAATPRGEGLGGVAMDVEGRVGDDGQALGAPAARQRALLQAVVAEVLHATDPHARRDVGHDPPVRTATWARPGRCGGDPRQSAQAALGERLDPGDRRVARTRRPACRRSRRRRAAAAGR